MNSNYRLIPLTRGYFAKVSPHRFDELNQWNWHAANRGGKIYACRQSQRGPNGRQDQIPMHRQILGLLPGDGRLGDHRDRDTLNNQDDNLRVADFSQNTTNTVLYKNNTSGYKGVYWIKKKSLWQASVFTRKKSKFLGYFSSREDAAQARILVAFLDHGEFMGAIQ